MSEIVEIEGRLYTEGQKLFDEQTVKRNGKEYRPFDPNRSKLAAAIVKKVKGVEIPEGTKILYLGAAHGYSVSHIASIIGEKGIIYAVEFSERCFNELLPIAQKLKNIAPIIADARKPELYSWIEKCDIVYVDVAQPDQIELSVRNARQFLKRNGILMIALKTQSIDVTKSSKNVLKTELEKLRAAKFQIIDNKSLEPFEERHFFIVAKQGL